MHKQGMRDEREQIRERIALQAELLRATAKARRGSRIGVAKPSNGWDVFMHEDGWYAHVRPDRNRRYWSTLQILENMQEAQLRLFLSFDWEPVDPKNALELLAMEAE